MSNFKLYTQEEEDGTTTSYEIWDDDTDSEGADYDAFCQLQLRLKRDALLLATDWWGASDQTMSDAQTAYRKALRDLPSSASPKLDSDDIYCLTNVTWPTKPQ